MPDTNKFGALASAGFRINPSCARCKSFNKGQDEWGTCSLIDYEHGKHSGVRKASVVQDGYCHRFEPDAAKLARLGAHLTFMEQKLG